MDRACSLCHGGLLDESSPHPGIELPRASVVPPPVVAPRHLRQHPAEVESCAACHREHQPNNDLVQVTDASCRRCHANLQMRDGQHTFYPRVTAFDGDHPPFGWWRGGGLQDPGALHFNHQIHLRLPEKSLHGIDGAVRRLNQLECRLCHRPDAQGRHMAPVRYERDCAECHPLAIRITATTNDSTVREAMEAFGRQPAPHLSPDLVSAVLRERLRRFAQQNPMIGKDEATSEPLRSFPGNRPRQIAPRDPSSWVDLQTAILQRLLFDSPGGCRYCHLAKAGSKPGTAPAEYESTNLPDSWFPYARFSHAKHGLMACGECHDQARTSTRTADVLMPTKQKCVECHWNQSGVRNRARADCLECHQYHGPGPREPAAPAGNSAG
ncbi:MAG TPA: cytochrome c3 family protein [Gemmataceae bacterium]|nr:cytochrome c3 family protein [Gemmataceae bacterium]